MPQSLRAAGVCFNLGSILGPLLVGYPFIFLNKNEDLMIL